MKCNVHPWMKGYIAVLKHPYFAVTDKNGHFEVKDLPPGTYTINAWQEKLGAQSQKITVTAGQGANLDFTSSSNRADSGSRCTGSRGTCSEHTHDRHIGLVATSRAARKLSAAGPLTISRKVAWLVFPIGWMEKARAHIAGCFDHCRNPGSVAPRSHMLG